MPDLCCLGLPRPVLLTTRTCWTLLPYLHAHSAAVAYADGALADVLAWQSLQEADEKGADVSQVKLSPSCEPRSPPPPL
jgi:hypothetical protein